MKYATAIRLLLLCAAFSFIGMLRAQDKPFWIGLLSIPLYFSLFCLAGRRIIKALLLSILMVSFTYAQDKPICHKGSDGQDICTYPVTYTAAAPDPKDEQKVETSGKGSLTRIVPTFEMRGLAGEIVMIIDENGVITFGKGIKPNEAAKQFAEYLKLYMKPECLAKEAK